MKKIIKDVLIILACVAALVVIVRFASKDEGFHEKYEGYDLTDDVGDIVRKNTYRSYLSKYANKNYPSIDIPVDIFAYDETCTTGVSTKNNYKGEKKALYTEDGSTVTWIVDVPQEGFYNILLDYIATPSRNIDMERIIYINGELPFSGADTLVFSRIWHDGAEVQTDNRGNQIRPSQKEVFAWQTAFCKSDTGYEIEPYCFYFKQGPNSITMEASTEPMAIRAITLKSVKKSIDYNAYKAKQSSSSSADNIEVIKLQGENAARRSDPSLFAKADRASPITEPYNVKAITLNYIGGDSWKSAGQWIEWDFTAPADGFYKIAVKGRQMYQRGSISTRSLYIDGEIPFSEMNALDFYYSSEWKQLILADKSGAPYEFFFKKGDHTLRLEVTMGGLGPIVNDIEDSIYRLNEIYRTIRVLTGVNPDVNRDYNLEQVYPDTIEAMNIESRRLYKVVDDYVAYTGEKSDKIASAQTLAVQLEEFYKKPYKITQAFQTFKENITALGTSLLDLTESKLDIDYIAVAGRNASIPKVNPSGFKKVAHSINSFISSYTSNSEELGNVYSKRDKDVISIWILSGTTGNRDQSTVLKTLIDQSFTPKTGVKVNVKLISQDSLLSAVVAGNGPDVVLGLASSLPIEYAIRNANENLMQFPDCEQVLSQFYPSAYLRYQFDGGLYALPETETFSLLFYRKDLLEQIGLEIPETWDELVSMLPTLQDNKLEVGIPYPTIQAPSAGIFYTQLYQNGGTVYNNNGSRCLIDNEEGVKAFKDYTSLYVNYGLAPEFDFATRFRQGLMVLGIQDYTVYNTLAVSAPEIRGLWDFVPIPGTLKTRSDGTTYIDRTVNADGVNCMMIKAKNETKKQNAWKFMKWWVSAETQYTYGREMESILGASGRYATANKIALKQLAWSTKQLKVLEDSLENSFAIPEVPGSYFTSRHITNAIRKVYNDKDEPREVIIDYTRKINEELTRKREEFGFETYEDQVKKNGGSK